MNEREEPDLDRVREAMREHDERAEEAAEHPAPEEATEDQAPEEATEGDAPAEHDDE